MGYLKLLFIAYLILLSYEVLSEQTQRFDNYKVYRITPNNIQALNVLKKLNHNLDDQVEFWTGIRHINNSVDIMVPPTSEERLKFILSMSNFQVKLHIKNVQELIDKENNVLISNRFSYGFSWENYHTLDEIHEWLKSLADDHPHKVTLQTAGVSYENRSILGVKVSFSTGNENRGVFLEGTIHAREWISETTVTWILNEILTSQDPEIRAIADSHDWYIFPVVNPDGFVYTKTKNRMWRKTRSPYGKCHGADANRNWGFPFFQETEKACNEEYGGPKAFSEPSVNCLSKYIRTIAHKLRAYISFHSYSQYLLVPYGYTSMRQDNYYDLVEIGLKAMRGLSKRYGTEYKVGNVVDMLYVSTGGSVDWVKGNFKIPITYTYELRDTGEYGFFLPVEEIIPTGKETMDSLLIILSQFNIFL